MSFFTNDIKVIVVPVASYLLYKLVKWFYRRTITLLAMDPTPYAARLLAPIFPSYTFDENVYYKADGVNAEIAAKRKIGAIELAKRFDALLGVEARKANDVLKAGLSDLRFTDTNRVPFQFQAVTRKLFHVATITQSSRGPELIDVDGVASVDVSGSYGVNVCGYDAYKRFLDQAWKNSKALGPNVLGPIHPIINRVLPRLKAIAKKEEVSFHMSGTEAVMCAVRLCRFNTKRKLIVQFAGAYHGWWDGVQPGPGSERANNDVLYLKDMSSASLAVIRARNDEIAAVLVSPLQGLNPGKPPPSDLVLLDAKARETAKGSKLAYKQWLHELRECCTKAEVPLMFDEVYTGFRMAPGGAQEYYEVTADVVVYGKTLGGGLAVGVVCGPSHLMRRFDPTRPLRVAYVIGTFAAAPLTLAAMAEFLDWLDKAKADNLYAKMEAATDQFVNDLNKELVEKELPIRLDNLTTVWTVLFKQPGRYHWMFQYYLRAEGLTLSWVGTGRCLFSLDFTPAHFAKVKKSIINAATSMKKDGWWDGDISSKLIKNRITKELISHASKKIFGSIMSQSTNNNKKTE
uniref:Glutamate-1-semialdehyde 2,1-aminomutase n=1 Tax=Aureoumbra lagunensis TaxID=44058 RepID=A0A7S3JQM1_9STRA|mmetsp:Transcript_1493/g.1994  ORF Transcript_1493/g.1994 Transcript_1493/m.1994 type:complete len:573 (+) Transcript_1493:60-1778(+)